MSPWAWLWTGLWFGGLSLFAGLSVAVIVRGARDVLSLFTTLSRDRAGEDPPGMD